MEHKSLQERCLQVIIEHLDQFCSIFNTTKDPKLKRNFEFLQRCYSNRILQGLSLSGVVKEDYFPLLINKYLRELNLGILDRVDPETIVRIIAEIGEGLMKISFSTDRNLNADPPFENIFPHLKNITILNMEDLCNDEALKNIAKYCPNLVELNIASSWITNEGLMHICQKNEKNEVPHLNLRKLNLRSTNVNDDLTELILTSFPHLEMLEAPSMPCILHKMHQKDIKQNTISDLKKYKLMHLDVILCTHLTTSPELFKFYALLCPDVNFLTAVVTNIDQLNALANFKKLKVVNLHHDEFFPYPSVNNFLGGIGIGLTVLNLNEFSLSVGELIKNCPLLKELHLKDVSFQPIVETITKKLKFLTEFYLEGAAFIEVASSKSVQAIILSAPKLEKICFCCCNYFTEELNRAISHCCIHCPLKEINFSHSEFEYHMLQSILACSSTLKVLRVVSPKIDFDNFMPNAFEKLSEIASSLRIKFEYEDSDSDFNSDGDLNDVFDFYDEFDAYDYFSDGSDDYDDYDDEYDDDVEDNDDF